MKQKQSLYFKYSWSVMIIKLSIPQSKHSVFKSPVSGTKYTYGLKVKGWGKIVHANRHDRKAGVATIISDKIDFKTKNKKNVRNK